MIQSVLDGDGCSYCGQFALRSDVRWGVSGVVAWFFQVCLILGRCVWAPCSYTAGSALSSTMKTYRSSAEPPQPDLLENLGHSIAAHIRLEPTARFHYTVALQCQEFRCLGPVGRNLVKEPSRPSPVWLVALLGGPVEGELCESPHALAAPLLPHQSVLSALHRPAGMEAWPSSMF